MRLINLLNSSTLLARIAAAEERQAVALEQLLLLVARSVGADPAAFRTFYEDHKDREEAEVIKVGDEELADMERRRRQMEEFGRSLEEDDDR